VQAGSLQLPKLKAGEPYSFAFSLETPAQLNVQLLQGARVLMEKSLHLGDADLFGTFAPVTGEPVRVELATTGGPVTGKYTLQVHAWDPAAPVEREPNNTWKEANAIRLGGTVFGSADDVLYVPATAAKVHVNEAGADWFRFEFNEPVPKLVYFELDLMERDNIPVDVSVHRVVNGETVAYRTGEDPVTMPHEVQALPGNKFTTRVPARTRNLLHSRSGEPSGIQAADKGLRSSAL
jgi:hypothetical protein